MISYSLIFLLQNYSLLLLFITLEATRRGRLRAISCQAGKLPERKDTHRKPLLPHLPGG